MQFLGGKSRLGLKIGEVIKAHRQPWHVAYAEPFVGGANVLVHTADLGLPRYAGDVDAELIALWQSAQRGWVPPTLVTEEQYGYAAANDNWLDPATRAFVKFGCSWGAKPWGGYARSRKEDRNFAAIGSASVLRKAQRLGDVSFHVGSYDAWQPYGALVYCDPPYAGTTGYRRTFDNDAFWAWVRRWSAVATILVSEYAAPEDFECVASFDFTRGLDDRRIVEKVFRYAGEIPAND